MWLAGDKGSGGLCVACVVVGVGGVGFTGVWGRVFGVGGRSFWCECVLLLV
jgi:hypothetical protein